MNIILEEAGGHRSIDENRRYLLTLYSSYCVKMEKKEKKKTIEVNALQSRKIAISVYLSISPRTHRRRRPRHLAAEFKESVKEKKEREKERRQITTVVNASTVWQYSGTAHTRCV